jgi:hypothetical protein
LSTRDETWGNKHAVSVSQTFDRGPEVVRGGPQAVSDEKASDKLLKTLNE